MLGLRLNSVSHSGTYSYQIWKLLLGVFRNQPLMATILRVILTRRSSWLATVCQQTTPSLNRRGDSWTHPIGPKPNAHIFKKPVSQIFLLSRGYLGRPGPSPPPPPKPTVRPPPCCL